ncbi:melanoma-associated antigen B10-like [Elephas maximus indicus]|uniref:melanoma-associated antigen B10-like n=1 Tax=Elephas maximus indicus TaxID=99487 RepID=UPI002115FE7B|nr:melanoma-associated antigen B10-like [Elephas maximus indicus]
MPRGQKSKLRAREKRRQAREETQGVKGAQATVAAEEEPTSSSSDCCKDPTQSSSAAETPSTPQGPPSALPPTTSEAAVSCTRANEGANYQGNESPSSAQAEPTTEHSQEGLDKKVVILVHYLLYKYQVREPVTKADMLRNIMQIYKNQFPEILRRASEHLELVFGLDLKEVDPIRHTYVLVNKLDSSSSGRISDDVGVPTTGLLMTVLGVIFTKGNCATEEEVWEVLNTMGLHAGRDHFIFGEPKKLITRDMVKQKYLEYRQVPNTDPPRYEFLWGPRAYAETTKMKVLEFVAKVHDTTPSAFPSCLEEAIKDEEERAQARVESRVRSSAMSGTHSRATPSSSSCPK